MEKPDAPKADILTPPFFESHLDRKLRWDPQQESFVGDDEADSLLERPRRAGFELPKIA